MDILDNKSDKELLQSLIAEVAKATGELKCARGDVEKAQNRLKFCILLAHTIIDRSKD
jgi:hypothetical protein